MKVFITPFFDGADKGEGGVRRAVDAQREWLPKLGIEIVDSPDAADLIVIHILEHARFFNAHADKPIVADCHGLYWSEYPWPDWALKANKEVIDTIKMSDVVIAHSEWVAQSIRRHTLRRVEVIPHGIELDEWQAREPQGYVLWNKNRPDPVCDPEPLAQLAERLPETQFVTTFWPEGRAALANVTVTGRLPFEQTRALVEAADVYLCTTRETFGVGTLEALAASVPVVGWAWGGQREFLTHQRDAWLAMPGDIDGLAEGVAWARENRATVAAAGRRTAGSFGIERIMKRYAQMLRRTLKEHGTRARGPRTSIIVTAYNLETYLPDCLKSVQGLEDDDWECIVVDDASPDGCGRIADQFAAEDSRFRVIHNAENVFHSEARNIGARAARGRYLLPLDADDMLAPAVTRLLAEALDTNRAIHIAYGNVLFIEEGGELSIYAKELDKGHSGWPMTYRYDWHEQQRNLLPYCSMMRREVWELVGGERRRFRAGEDADFWLRAASYGFVPRMVTNADTLIYRNREGSVSRTNAVTPWGTWYPWREWPEMRPAGAPVEGSPPVASLDPPRVSVVIPVGAGHEKYLIDALDSIDAQTFRQWECIIVNDTGAPLPWTPSWARVIKTPGAGHAGVAAARNAGILVARSRFFVPLDADDYLQPDALRQLMEAREAAGPKTVVYSAWYDAREGGQHEIFMPDAFRPETLMEYLRTRGALHAVTALYERSAWEKVGGFDEELPAWEDWDFQLALYEHDYCSVLVPQPLWVYRKHTGFRREGNYADFETGKESILKKWGAYFKGGQELGSCRSCGGRKAQAAPSQQQPAVAGGSNGGSAEPQSAVLIEYVGGSIGNRRFRGPSGHFYVFGGGRNRIKYVLEADVAFFLSHQDFRRAPDSVVLPATPAIAVESEA